MTATTTVPETPTLPKEDQETKTRQMPPYNVVLLDDNDHTYDYVIHMLQSIFGYPREKCYLLALEVDTQGRVIVLTTYKELAELKRDQIHSFGADHRLPRCQGSMSAVIEPVPTC
jgi:ATP-dependent Clp protease adaptor protein ClpS